jgi:hypothetical protein
VNTNYYSFLLKGMFVGNHLQEGARFIVKRRDSSAREYPATIA